MKSAMRILILFSIIFRLALQTGILNAQTVLLEEDFNNCALPSTWQVKLNGNQNVQWYVGLSQNGVNAGQSLDSTCFLFIDDNATGNNTPGYTLEFISPAFDASLYERVVLSLDAHFRHNPNGPQSFDILVSDGTTERLLTRFDGSHSNGVDFGAFSTLKFDLTLWTKSPTARLIFRYNDSNGAWGWWAGIDNIKVTGSGSGSLVLGETFSACSKPAGWTTEIVSGQLDWSFGLVPSTSSAFYDGSSMDGSCFAYFDDNAAGENAPPTTIRLISPWFSGTDYFTYTLTYDLILRFTGEAISVYVENESGAKSLLFQSSGHVGGPFFPAYKTQTYDLTPYRSDQLRIVFEYSDKGLWGYWVGIDNVKVTGDGAAFDFCAQARPLQTGQACTPATNQYALFDGPPATCTGRTVAGLWYRWTADFSGIARLSTGADFNDVVQLYSGDCTNLQPVLCDNRDEHGFTGENTYFEVETGTNYLIRISGQEEGYGVPRGNLCPLIENVNAYPAKPVNDDCQAAQPLVVDGPCVGGNNRNAGMSAQLPSLNLLARADVWYAFTAPSLAASEQLSLNSNANFSDIMTVYQGTCNNLTEVAGNHKGGAIDLASLATGQTYYVQIAGTFATVEGDLCPVLKRSQGSSLANDNCLNALTVPVGGACIEAENRGATFSGLYPSCAVSVDRDIWFKFTATSGAAQINTGATFEHTLAVWEGSCASLKPIACFRNPLRCNGYVTVSELNPGQTYYVQIASWNGPAGLNAGDVCVKILDGHATPDFSPLGLEVLQPCVGMDTVQLFVSVSGGKKPYTFPAAAPGQILTSGSPFAVIVLDAMGCQVQQFDTVQACASSECNVKAVFALEHPACFGDSSGVIQANMFGASGPLYFSWSNNVFTAQNSNLPAGTYTLTVTETSGCVYRFEEQLVQPDAIQITPDSIRQPFQGQSNGSLHVQVLGGTGVLGYTWFRNDTLLSTLEDLDSIPSGLYTLKVVDEEGCEQVFSYNLTSTVSTQTPDQTIQVFLFPNPAHDRTTLSVLLPDAKPLQLSLFDAFGRVRSWQTAGPAMHQQMELSLQDLPSGVYLLQIRTEGNAGVTRRLIVGK